MAVVYSVLWLLYFALFLLWEHVTADPAGYCVQSADVTLVDMVSLSLVGVDVVVCVGGISVFVRIFYCDDVIGSLVCFEGRPERIASPEDTKIFSCFVYFSCCFLHFPSVVSFSKPRAEGSEGITRHAEKKAVHVPR